MKKQSMSRYQSLMNRIAIVMLLECLLIYFCGRVLSFSRGLLIIAEGYNILADIIFLLLECIVSVIIYMVPVWVFNYFQRNAFREKNMPVQKEILSKERVLPVFVLGLCAIFVGFVVNNIAVNFFLDIGGFAEDYLFLSGMKYNYQIIFYIISLAVIPAIFEELLFRKVICDALAPYGATTAIIVSSVVFSLMHTDFTRIAHTFITGLFCAWLYIGTKNLKLSIFLHFLNNLFAAIETIIAYRASNTTAITFLRLRFLIFLVVGIVMFVRLYKMRQREVLGIVRKARENGEFEAFLEKKKKYINYIEMLPDENGEEVISLSTKERISGFFSPAMIVFVVAVFIQMLYYISFSLV